VKVIRLGTRGSQLALVQARLVDQRLLAHGVRSETIVIRTTADGRAETPLAELGTKRVFVKELEDALAAGTIDVAVHSSKDLPAALPEGLDLAAALPREDPRDALVLGAAHPGRDWTRESLARAIGQAPRIGTSSLRRIVQLRRLWPSASFVPIRGNLDTRLRKLDHGEYDVLVLAVAGLNRLGSTDRVSMPLPVSLSVPAPGQGIVSLEIRRDDESTRGLVSPVNDEAAMTALAAERAVVLRLAAGCRAPLGAFARADGDGLRLTAVVASVDGEVALRHEATGPRGRPADLGIRVAEALLGQGARALLDEAERSAQPASEPPE
jgi:hydroxymethylbilane synthase